MLPHLSPNIWPMCIDTEVWACRHFHWTASNWTFLRCLVVSYNQAMPTRFLCKSIGHNRLTLPARSPQLSLSLNRVQGPFILKYIRTNRAKHSRRMNWSRIVTFWLEKCWICLHCDSVVLSLYWFYPSIYSISYCSPTLWVIQKSWTTPTWLTWSNLTNMTE